MTSKVMSIPDQRARAAKLMRYIVKGPGETYRKKCDVPSYVNKKGFWMCTVADYTPDTNLQQADELKARLRELGLFHTYKWSSLWKTHNYSIEKLNDKYCGKSKLSEGAALLDAVSKIPQEGD